jgi:hypothetical protein
VDWKRFPNSKGVGSMTLHSPDEQADADVNLFGRGALPG